MGQEVALAPNHQEALDKAADTAKARVIAKEIAARAMFATRHRLARTQLMMARIDEDATKDFSDLHRCFQIRPNSFPQREIEAGRFRKSDLLPYATRTGIPAKLVKQAKEAARLVVERAEQDAVLAEFASSIALWDAAPKERRNVPKAAKQHLDSYGFEGRQWTAPEWRLQYIRRMRAEDAV